MRHAYDNTCLTEYVTSYDVVLLTGAAGTGKTTLVREIVEHLNSQGMRCVLMAPTGRAAKVLAERVGCSAATIHKTIYQAEALLEYLDGDGGATTFKWIFNLKANSDDANTVYIVDEVSMVSDALNEDERFRFGSGRLLSDLMSYIDVKATNNSRRIIFVGDSAQLPPVGSATSPALCEEYLAERFGVSVHRHELTVIHRQDADCGILDNAMRIRDGIEKRSYVAFMMEETADVSLLRQDGFLAKYREVTQGRPSLSVLVVAYSNELVRQYNRRIRQVMFPTADGPVVGDHLLVVQNNYRLDPILFNGDFVELISVSAETVKQSVRIVEEYITLTFRRARVRLLGDEQAQDVLLIEDLLESNEPSLSDKQQDALYVNFKMRYPNLKPSSDEFMAIYRADPFVNALRVKYGYAVTCHKAQGGEWPTVFVDYYRGGSQYTEEYFRWAYTATTRAKNSLYVLNAPNRSVLTVAQPITVDAQASLADVVVLKNEELNAKESLMERVLQESVCGAGFVINETLRHSYRTYYFVIKENETLRLEINYSGNNVITSIVITPTSSAHRLSLHEAVCPLIGKRLIGINGAKSEVAPQTETALKGMQATFDQALRVKAMVEQVVVSHVRQLTDYQLRYTFMRQGHECVVDYSLNKRGVVTDVRPLNGRTTDKILLDAVLTLTEGVSHV